MNFFCRASSSYCNYVHNSEDEVNIVKCFASLVRSQMERYFNEVAYLTDSPGLYKYAGECALRKKDYPAEHPLARSY